MVGRSWSPFLISTDEKFDPLAFQDIKPSAMLLMGAGVMGFMARRRKQVAA